MIAAIILAEILTILPWDILDQSCNHARIYAISIIPGTPSFPLYPLKLLLILRKECKNISFNIY